MQNQMSSDTSGDFGLKPAEAVCESLNQTPNVLSESLRPETTDDHTLPAALAVDLPPLHDALLKRIIDRAMKRCKVQGWDTKRLFRKFLSGSFTAEEYGAAISSLNTAPDGSTPKGKVNAWLLGIAQLSLDDRQTAARVLRSVVSKPPSHLLSGGRRRIAQATKWAAISVALCGVPAICIVGIDRLGTGNAAGRAKRCGETGSDKQPSVPGR